MDHVYITHDGYGFDSQSWERFPFRFVLIDSDVVRGRVTLTLNTDYLLNKKSRECETKSHIIRLKFKLNQLHAVLTYSRVGRGNLVLKHSVPDCPPNSGGIAC